MKRKDMQELHTKDKIELQTMVSNLEGQLQNMKMDHKLGKLKNPRSIFFTRKAIAQVKTVLRGKK